MFEGVFEAGVLGGELGVADEYVNGDDESAKEIQCEVRHRVTECFVPLQGYVLVRVNGARSGLHELLCVGVEEVIVGVFAYLPQRTRAETEHQEVESQKVFVAEQYPGLIGHHYVRQPKGNERQDHARHEVQERVPPRITTVKVESVAEYERGKGKDRDGYDKYQRDIDQEPLTEQDRCREECEHQYVLQAAEEYSLQGNVRLEEQIDDVGNADDNGEDEQGGVKPFETLMRCSHNGYGNDGTFFE